MITTEFEHKYTKKLAKMKKTISNMIHDRSQSLYDPYAMILGEVDRLYRLALQEHHDEITVEWYMINAYTQSESCNFFSSLSRLRMKSSRFVCSCLIINIYDSHVSYACFGIEPVYQVTYFLSVEDKPVTKREKL